MVESHAVVYRVCAAFRIAQQMTMKKILLNGALTLLAFAAGTMFSHAASATLNQGDPAPKLQTGTWVQGEPVKDFEKGKAYIVEFWATWCGPCRVSIPHLNEIHNKFKDKNLVVIGQDCSERDDALVAPFVTKMADKMTYRVALDDKSSSEKGAMAQTWMQAANQNGIPTAFLVDTKGTIAWIGHPMNLKEHIIEDVLADKFDAKKAAAEAKQQEEAMSKVFAAMQKKDWNGAETALNDAEKTIPAEERDNLDQVRLSILFNKRDYLAAYKLMDRFSEAHKDNADLQNALAWRIATDKQIEDRNLDVAEKIANRGNEAAKGKDAGILDTLARIKFMQGKKDEAIELQQKAVELAEADSQTQFKKVLESYRKGKLPQGE
jgi:thiol-disulfide isomerase/thioredoxin